MENSVILLSSVTWAIRAQKLLEQHGIRTTMKKISHNRKLGGCGYGLELPKSQLQAALRHLKTANIRIIDVL